MFRGSEVECREIKTEEGPLFACWRVKGGMGLIERVRIVFSLLFDWRLAGIVFRVKE